MIFSGLFAMTIGIGMIGMWGFLLFRNAVPELVTEPLRIRFHIAAEFTTAIALVIGGFGLLTGASWSHWLYLIAMGMLFYTVITSPGYYADRGEWPFVGLFALILMLGLLSLFFVLSATAL